MQRIVIIAVVICLSVWAHSKHATNDLSAAETEHKKGVTLACSGNFVRAI